MKKRVCTLFDPIRLGRMLLANRIVMAPMTRNRALAAGCPGPLTLEYYQQRASAGLIISEACAINPLAHAHVDTPGIYRPEQVLAWARVTQAVHDHGGRIFAQLAHGGRLSHASLLPPGQLALSSTALRAMALVLTADGYQHASSPRALADAEISCLIDDYVLAARNAMRAGFDGVEIEAGNAGLLDQFLRDSVNHRAPPYGGGIVQRSRLLLDVAGAVGAAIGCDRVGVRLSPATTFMDTRRDSQPQVLYGHVLKRLSSLRLAYVHLVEGETCGDRAPAGLPALDYTALRACFDGVWMVNNGYERQTAMQALASASADMVAFGRLFVSNPDLVRRLRDNAMLAPLQPETLYRGGRVGYVDYPALPGGAAAPPARGLLGRWVRGLLLRS